MRRVKNFHAQGSSYQLTEEMNVWLEEHPDCIPISVSLSRVQNVFSCLLLYEIVEHLDKEATI